MIERKNWPGATINLPLQMVVFDRTAALINRLTAVDRRSFFLKDDLGYDLRTWIPTIL
jgi:hypothetical protein